MVLQKQKFLLNLGQGVDTKTDPKHVVPGKCSVLENGVFKKGQRVDKRNGFDGLPTKLVDGSSLPTGDSLASFNNELLLYANQTLYSYSEGSMGWVEKGDVVSATVTTEQVLKNTYSQTQADSAYNQGVEVHAWMDSRGGIRASVIDHEDGTGLLTDVEISASGSRARCIAFSNYLYVFYYDSGSLYLRRLNPLSPTAFESAVLVSDTVNTTDPNYDVLPYNLARILFCHNVESSSEINCGWLDVEGAVLSGSLAQFTIAEAADDCLSVIQGPLQTFYFAWHNVSGLRCAIYNSGGAELIAPLTVENPANAVVNVTGFSYDTGVEFIYEVSAANPDQTTTRRNTVTNAGSAGTPSQFLRSVGLASKAFVYENEESQQYAFVALTHQSTLQSTFFIARSDGLIVAKQQYTIGGGLISYPILANVWTVSGTQYFYSILNKTQLISENAVIFTPKGVAKTSIDFTNERNFTSAQLGNNLHVIGGVLSMYDGQSVVEHGFLLYPERMSASASGSAGVANGAYNYIAVYEWTDNYGQIHRSAPSVPLAFTVTSGPKNVSIVVDTLRLTAKQGIRTPVSIVLYRTEAGPGDIYYRVTSISSPTYNDTSTDSVTVVDTTIDSALISHEILYTVGGVLENFSAPACSSISVYKNRIFLAGLENSDEIWFSKEHRAGEPVEFNDTLKKNIEPTGGAIQALQVLDDKILFLKADRWYYSYGDGPNNTGLLGDFSEPLFVSSDIGCTNPNSLVRFPKGILLKTGKGIYAIDSTLNSVYIGAEVEGYNHLEITSATLVANNNQVRFTTRDGDVLVYDYFFNQWSTFTRLQANDAILWKEQYVLLKTTGTILLENASVYRDNHVGYGLKLLTGWVSLDTVGGWQRIYQMIIVGEYKSPHILRVSIGYDYNPGFIQTIYLTPKDILQVKKYGEDSPYGNSSSFGGISLNYSFSINMKQQKCQAMRFLIEEITSSGTEGSGEGLTISDIGLLVGIKGNIAKLRQAQNF